MKGVGILTLKSLDDIDINSILEELTINRNSIISNELDFYFTEIDKIPEVLPEHISNFVFTETSSHIHYSTYAGKFVRPNNFNMSPAELFSVIQNHVECISVDKNYRINITWKSKDIDPEYADKIRNALVLYANNNIKIEKELTENLNNEKK